MASAVRLAPGCSVRTGTAPHHRAATTTNAATGIGATRIIELTKLDITGERSGDRATRTAACAARVEFCAPVFFLRSLRALRLPFKGRAVRVCCAIVAMAAFACGGGAQSPQVRREPGLNVLLITIDTLRADAIGAYGNAKAATPWLDRLSAGGVRFTQARAHNVVTLPSHVNILSGEYPLHHGVRENSGY